MSKAQQEHLPLKLIEPNGAGPSFGHAAPVSNTVSSDLAALLMSIKPEFASAILAGVKTVELRRRPPTATPPVVVIYASGKGRAVLGTAHLDAIYTALPDEVWAQYGTQTGVTRAQFDDYFNGSPTASALLLSASHPAERIMSLSDLRQIGMEPPQSWRYMSTRQLNVVMGALYTDRSNGRAPSSGLLALSRDTVGLPRLWCWFNQRLHQTVRPAASRLLAFQQLNRSEHSHQAPHSHLD